MNPLTVFTLAAVYLGTILIGNLIASLFKPDRKLTSATQHFAAGVVFAAVAIELIPKISVGSGWLPVTIGFVLGIGTMLLVDGLTHRLESSADAPSNQALPWGLIIGIAIDLLIDGILLGVAFLVGERSGILIASALGVEILFLGITVGTVLRQRNIPWLTRMGLDLILGVALPLGAMFGLWLFQEFPPQWTTEILAFGVAALLYLVTEGLLKEAHRSPDTPWVMVSFFLGFLIIFILNQVVP